MDDSNTDDEDETKIDEVSENLSKKEHDKLCVLYDSEH